MLKGKLPKNLFVNLSLYSIVNLLVGITNINKQLYFSIKNNICDGNSSIEMNDINITFINKTGLTIFW